MIIGFRSSSASSWSEAREVTTGSLIRALGEHVGRSLQLRVLRPGDAAVTLSITALEALGGTPPNL